MKQDFARHLGFDGKNTDQDLSQEVFDGEEGKLPLQILLRLPPKAIS